MSNILRDKLLAFKKKTITLSELEKMVGKAAGTYSIFAEEISKLETAGILLMVKAKGRNGNNPSLAYQYRINKGLLNKAYHQTLQHYRIKLDDAINLDTYFQLSHQIWEKDLPYIKKINDYITTNGFPTEAAAAPERSFELVGDEKWIVEKNGSEVLNRTGLWDKLRIFPVSDPLMFAINPHTIHQHMHLHLIIENKTTYQGLLPVLVNTPFSTLIYGSGNKIVRSIENFRNQYPACGKHVFYYFGDIDQSGVTIWYSLQQREKVIPATVFYYAALKKAKAYGKTNQRPNREALDAFLSFFTAKEAEEIRKLLEEGAYYPQEVLKTNELQKIWEETEWRPVLIP